jgi:hypothetical protein
MRVITKVGDVFETTDKKYLLQLVAIDSVQLNSDVITIYRIRSPLNLPTLPAEQMLFYHHTSVAEGVKQGLWNKVGRAPLPDISKLTFKTYFTPDDVSVMQLGTDEDSKRPTTQPHWAIWTPVNKEWGYVRDRAGLKLKAEDGMIVPPRVITERLLHGGKAEPPRFYPDQSMQPRLHDVLWLNQGLNTKENEAIEHIKGKEWFATGEFSLYDAYDRLYNKTKPFYRRVRGNKDGDLGYMFEFIACSPGFPQIASNYFSAPVPKTFLIVKDPSPKEIKESLRLKIGHAYFKTLEELRDHLLDFADVSELDYAIDNLVNKQKP